MNLIEIGIISFLTGFIASMGLGGGMVLIIFLTIFAGVSQIAAQGINLVFFIPIAALSLIIHTKNHLVEWKKIIPSVICGCVIAIFSSYFAGFIGSQYLKKIFAVFIILIGLYEIFSKKEKA